MTTVDNVLTRARTEHLLGADEDELNRLDAAYTAQATSMTFEFDMGGIQRGALLAVELAEYHVWSRSGQVATVEPGFNGSTSTNHDEGTLVRVNPRFRPFSMFNHLNDELRALSARGLGQIKEVEFTFDTQKTGFDLDGSGTILGSNPRKVTWDQQGQSQNWPTIRRYRLDKGANTSDFPSGNALFVFEHVDHGQDVRVQYDAPLDTVSAVGDDIETTTGLHAEAHDILPMGVALRMVASREIPRNDPGRQGGTRRAEEVPPGGIQQSYRGLQDKYDERIDEEIERLEMRAPRIMPQ